MRHSSKYSIWICFWTSDEMKRGNEEELKGLPTNCHFIGNTKCNSICVLTAECHRKVNGMKSPTITLEQSHKRTTVACEDMQSSTTAWSVQEDSVMEENMNWAIVSLNETHQSKLSYP